MNLFKSGAALATALLVATTALANKTGNGGGAIKIGDRTYTFAQAGLRFPTEPTDRPFTIAEEPEACAQALAYLDALERAVPKLYLDPVRRALFEPKHGYVRDEVTSPAALAKIRADYARYVSAIGVPGARFDLMAYTLGATTHLLPQFAAKATEIKALNLLHENWFYLNPSAQLDAVLQLDVAVENYLRAPSDPRTLLPLYDALDVWSKPSSPRGCGPAQTDPCGGFELGGFDPSVMAMRAYEAMGFRVFVGAFMKPDAEFDARRTEQSTYESYVSPSEQDEADIFALRAADLTLPGFMRRFYRVKLQFANLSRRRDRGLRYPSSMATGAWNARAGELRIRYYAPEGHRPTLVLVRDGDEPSDSANLAEMAISRPQAVERLRLWDVFSIANPEPVQHFHFW